MFFHSLEKHLKYHFLSEELALTALTHKSYKNEKKIAYDNERLEFLGDSVLSTVLSELLMKIYPEMNEGELSKMRAHLINERFLAKIANQLDLQSYLKLGHGETLSGGHLKPRLLASAFEALIGAIYLDGGFEKARDVVHFIFKDKVKIPKFEEKEDYKTYLQEMTQKKYDKVPTYKVSEESGPEHEKVFSVELYLDSKVLAKGSGTSKKRAEQAAAKIAILDLEGKNEL